MARIHCVTYSCPRCGRPFVSETEMKLHYLSCGARMPVGIQLIAIDDFWG